MSQDLMQEFARAAAERVRLFDRPTLAERIKQAIQHAETHGQMNDALWPHQPFALTLGELRPCLLMWPAAPTLTVWQLCAQRRRRIDRVPRLCPHA